MQTYVLYLIPNLLSQAVVLNRYLEKIKAYEEEGNEAGIIYIYALIFRKIFLYEMPNVNEIQDDLDTWMANRTKDNGDDFDDYKRKKK